MYLLNKKIRVKKSNNQEFEGKFKYIDPQKGQLIISEPYEIIRKEENKKLITLKRGHHTQFIQFKLGGWVSIESAPEDDYFLEFNRFDQDEANFEEKEV